MEVVETKLEADEERGKEWDAWQPLCDNTRILRFWRSAAYLILFVLKKFECISIWRLEIQEINNRLFYFLCMPLMGREEREGKRGMRRTWYRNCRIQC